MFFKNKIQAPLFLTLLLLVIGNFASAASPAIELTDDEQKWLGEHPRIRLAVDIDWSPFEYIDNNKNYVGMASEYINLVSQKLGIEFDVEKEKPWSEVVAMVKKRELDMYSCVVSTVQRREYVNFTQPYLTFPMVIVTSDQIAYVNGIKDLQGERVAVVRGYATQDLLEKNHPELELYLAKNVADALEQLSHGKVYAYVGNIATVSHAIKRDGITNVKISGETPYNYELSMAVRNDWPEFIPILQKALDSITEEEKNQIYRNWIKLRYEYGFDYTLLWQVLAVVFLVLTVILIWNRRLSFEIGKRSEAERQLEQANEQLVDYIDIVDKYVITSTTNEKGIITAASEAFCKISEYTLEEMIGKSHSILRHKDMPESLYKELWGTITKGKTWEGEIKNKKKNGRFYWVQAYISPMFDEQGKITGYTAIREDITDRKRAESLSITDELTSLFNRRHFNKEFPKELARARRDKKTLALMIIDVDYFKPYNDNYGHQQGDTTLQAVANALDNALKRPSDFAYRIGGEEFGVIVLVNSSNEARQTAEMLRKTVEDLKLEHRYSKTSKYVTVSVGLKTHTPHKGPELDEDQIYRLADDALYQAKENGRNRVAGN